MAAVMHELGGVANGNANHRPVRTRLHDLEGNDAAVTLLAEFRREKRQRWQWTVMAIFSGIGIFLSLLVLIVAIFSGTS